jgi:hypothetical protein
MDTRLIVWKDITSECSIEFGKVTGTRYVIHGMDPKTGEANFIGQIPPQTRKVRVLDYLIQEVEKPDFSEDAA